MRKPAWVLSETAIRERCGAYRQALADSWSDSAVAYAGKALLPLAICRLMDEENMCLDVASGGELYAARAAGFPAERMIYHGNNKSTEEIRMGLAARVGRFICDNFEELDRIDELTGNCDHRPSVLLRITPGIDTALTATSQPAPVPPNSAFSWPAARPCAQQREPCLPPRYAWQTLVNGTDAQLIVARQSYADLLCGEIIPHHLSARNQVAAGQ